MGGPARRVEFIFLRLLSIYIFLIQYNTSDSGLRQNQYWSDSKASRVTYRPKPEFSCLQDTYSHPTLSKSCKAIFLPFMLLIVNPFPALNPHSIDTTG